MAIATEPNPLALDRPDDVRRVRDVLDRAGYDFDRVFGRIAPRRGGAMSLGSVDRPRVLRLTGDGDPQAVLIRLFVVGLPVPLDEFRRAAEPMDPLAWAEIGLVAIDGDAVRRLVDLKPFGPFILVNDPKPERECPRDYVPGVSTTTIACDRVLVRFPVRRALDLGTGSGYLALRAAQHSGNVVATDLNARAVAFARFNAMINRLDNVETAVGSLYEPVEGTFDLIACNPPFVVSPQDGLIYRDSGLEADAICERVLRGAPVHLAEGGFAQVMCNWVRIAGRDWVERLSSWFERSGCDVWIIHSESHDPAEYAQQWLGHSGPSDPAALGSAFEQWMAYYERQRIEAVDSGIISLRRRSGGRNWLRVDQDRNPDHYSGAAIMRGFAAYDLGERMRDEGAPLGMTLRCRPDVVVSQKLEPGASGWMVAGADCILDGGLRFEGGVSPTVFHVLTLCRGQFPVAAVLEQVAARVGRDAHEFRGEFLEVVRSLAAQGFLWPADSPLDPWPPGEPGGMSPA
jgi:SAM-dependent methyltransferase